MFVIFTIIQVLIKIITRCLADGRFTHLFTRSYQHTEGVFVLGYGLIVETRESLAFPARSRLECSTCCRELRNCSSIIYIHENTMCKTNVTLDVVLPW